MCYNIVTKVESEPSTKQQKINYNNKAQKGINTMNAPRINHNERTIEITKKYAKAASTTTSNAYKELKEIRIDNPGYKVVVREVSKKTSVNNRITLSTMENYIKLHDPDGTIMEEFKRMRDEKVGENLEKTNFFQIKKWFLNKYTNLKKDSSKNEVENEVKE